MEAQARKPYPSDVSADEWAIVARHQNVTMECDEVGKTSHRRHFSTIGFESLTRHQPSEPYTFLLETRVPTRISCFLGPAQPAPADPSRGVSSASSRYRGALTAPCPPVSTSSSSAVGPRSPGLADSAPALDKATHASPVRTSIARLAHPVLS